VVMFRAVRDAHGGTQSNLHWNYGHATIPRHLRDVYVNEYGIADLHYRNDEDCVVAMAGIADVRFRQALLDPANTHRKLRADFTAPERWDRNTPQRLGEALAPFRADGTLPDYPLGSDFTAVEQRLVRALGWLQANTTGRIGKLRTVMTALLRASPADQEAMQRMDLETPRSIGDYLQARLLGLALQATSRHDGV